jgi:hypothetical protein
VKHGAFHPLSDCLVFLQRCGYHFSSECLWNCQAVTTREESNGYNIKNRGLITCVMCANHPTKREKKQRKKTFVYMRERERERICTSVRIPEVGTA